MNKIVWSLFSSGAHGTWLNWFINQHSGFPKDKVKLFKRRFPNGNISDYMIEKEGPAYWDYNKEYKHQYENICLKLFPNHLLFSDEHRIHELIKKSGCTHIVISEVNVAMRGALHDRMKRLRPNWSRDKINRWPPNPWRINEELMDVNVPILRLDIGKILLADYKEYAKLCTFLEVDELPIWKSYVKKVQEEIYDKS